MEACRDGARSLVHDARSTFRGFGRDQSAARAPALGRRGTARGTLGAQIEEQLRRRSATGALQARRRRSRRRATSPASSASRAGRGRRLRASSPPRATSSLRQGARPRVSDDRRRERGTRRRPRRGAAAALRLPPQRPRRLRLPARRLAALAARGARDDAPTPTSATATRAAIEPLRRGARRLPRPRARRGRRPVARRDHQRLHPGARAASATRSPAAAPAASRSRTRATREQREIARRAGLEPVPVAVDERRPARRRARRDGRRRRRHPRPPAPDRRACSPASGAPRCSRWLRDHDAIAIEDDYDAEYRYDRAAVGALQGLEPDRVVYAGSASKTLAPALRLGWLVVPAALLERDPRARSASPTTGTRADRPARVRATSSRAASSTATSAACARRYRARRDALVAALADELPEADGQRHRRRAPRHRRAAPASTSARSAPRRPRARIALQHDARLPEPAQPGPPR